MARMHFNRRLEETLRIVRALNVTRQVVIADRVAVADTFLRRGWGLLGHARLLSDEGMLMTNTNCVHSMFMRFAFDALYIDRDGHVCALALQLPPFRMGPLVRRARHVLELASGTIDRTGTVKGDLMAFEDTQPVPVNF